MAFLSEDALRAMGFAALGRNVLISDKAAIYNADRIRIGNNSRIDDFCVVSGRVEIGRNSHFSPFCLVNGGTAGIFVGDFVGLSYGTKVFAHTDDYSGAALIGPTVPKAYTNVRAEPVHICDHVVSGAGSIIGAGVTVAEGTALGAATLILKSTEPWSIYVGSPARRLRERSRDMLACAAAYLADETEGDKS